MVKLVQQLKMLLSKPMQFIFKFAIISFFFHGCVVDEFDNLNSKSPLELINIDPDIDIYTTKRQENGDLLAVGHKKYSGKKNGVIIEINGQGKLMNFLEIQESGNQTFTNIILLKDGNYAVVGNTDQKENSQNAIFTESALVEKYNRSGKKIDSFYYGLTAYDAFFDIIELDNGNLIVTGSSIVGLNSSNTAFLHLLSLNESLDVVWDIGSKFEFEFILNTGHELFYENGLLYLVSSTYIGNQSPPLAYFKIYKINESTGEIIQISEIDDYPNYQTSTGDLNNREHGFRHIPVKITSNNSSFFLSFIHAYPNLDMVESDTILGTLQYPAGSGVINYKLLEIDKNSLSTKNIYVDSFSGFRPRDIMIQDEKVITIFDSFDDLLITTNDLDNIGSKDLVQKYYIRGTESINRAYSISRVNGGYLLFCSSNNETNINKSFYKIKLNENFQY